MGCEWGSIPTRDGYLEIRSRWLKQRALHRRRLSHQERHALDGYANKHVNAKGQRINRYLYQRRGRRHDSQVAREIALLDSALLSSSVHAPGTLFRGLSGPALAEFTSAWAPGVEVIFPSFLSTSFMPLQALLYAGVGGCIVKFEFPSGTEVRAVFSPREDEFVLPRGLSWVVHRVCQDLSVPPRVLVHPVHGSYRAVVDEKVRMFVMAPARRTKTL